jgi:hypothetical protein
MIAAPAEDSRDADVRGSIWIHEPRMIAAPAEDSRDADVRGSIWIHEARISADQRGST